MTHRSLWPTKRDSIFPRDGGIAKLARESMSETSAEPEVMAAKKLIKKANRILFFTVTKYTSPRAKKQNSTLPDGVLKGILALYDAHRFHAYSCRTQPGSG